MPIIEYFIRHSGSTTGAKMTQKCFSIEPYLTFLNIHQLERQGADIQEILIQACRLRYSVTRARINHTKGITLY